MRKRFLLAGWALVFSVTPVFGQQVITYGSISGRVTDPSGAVVPAAQVTASPDGHESDIHRADGFRGSFPISIFESRDLRNHGSPAGFADAHRTLTLTIGSAFDVPVSLSVGGVDTSVTVTGDATVLEGARSQIAGTVSQTEVQDLPLNGRNFLDLALLIPGVSPPNVSSTQLFAETSAVPGVGISVGSQRNFSNNFIVDGLSANDDAAGLSGIPYGVDAVDQFQVVTSGGQAELVAPWAATSTS